VARDPDQRFLQRRRPAVLPAGAGVEDGDVVAELTLDGGRWPRCRDEDAACLRLARLPEQRGLDHGEEPRVVGRPHDVVTGDEAAEQVVDSDDAAAQPVRAGRRDARTGSSNASHRMPVLKAVDRLTKP
jgi:hypothetical protein